MHIYCKLALHDSTFECIGAQEIHTGDLLDKQVFVIDLVTAIGHDDGESVEVQGFGHLLGQNCVRHV